MARPTEKLDIRLDLAIATRLKAYLEKSGKSKTSVVAEALDNFLFLKKKEEEKMDNRFMLVTYTAEGNPDQLKGSQIAFWIEYHARDFFAQGGHVEVWERDEETGKYYRKFDDPAASLEELREQMEETPRAISEDKYTLGSKLASISLEIRQRFDPWPEDEDARKNALSEIEYIIRKNSFTVPAGLSLAVYDCGNEMFKLYESGTTAVDIAEEIEHSNPAWWANFPALEIIDNQ